MTTINDFFSVRGQIALVTGASRGIGAAIADTLGQAGATLIGTATSNSGAEAIEKRFQAAAINGRGAILDVTQPDSVNGLLKDISAREGDVSILVNNAGITRDSLLLRMKQADWDAVLSTNLSSAFHLSKGVLRGMLKARHGRIISISSVVGSMGNAGQSNYAATKSGLVGFSKALAREVGPRGITVNVIAPGFIETEMTAALTEAQREELSDQVPLNRLGQVTDVAGAALFLASPAGNYITGETIHVNGGMYMI
ncbi:MAG: 3-oxoacyl-ACP reductase FabG [Gammaproteobacteria bacterium]|nr:3-oxoacyl-ACP reductase FabG [Gammaproteobacteria bacterium]